MNLNQYLIKNKILARQFASEIGVQPPLLSQWRTNERRVPLDRCVAIETATQGQVTRKDLRPDDWHLIWTELLIESKKPTKVSHDM